MGSTGPARAIIRYARRLYLYISLAKGQVTNVGNLVHSFPSLNSKNMKPSNSTLPRIPTLIQVISNHLMEAVDMLASRVHTSSTSVLVEEYRVTTYNFPKLSLPFVYFSQTLVT